MSKPGAGDADPGSADAKPRPLELADAFNDLMFGAAALGPSDFNEIERTVFDRATNTLLGNLPLKRLPQLPATTARLLGELNDPDISVDSILRLVNRDVGLAAEMLKLANSVYFRRSDQEVTNLRQAVVVVGLNGLKQMLANLVLGEVVKIKPIYFRMFGQQLWQHSEECAIACSKLAAGQQADSYTAYLLGLVHDVGKIVMFQLLLEAFRSVHPGVEPRPHVLVKLITERSAPLSHLVAQSWEFPRPILDALREQAQRTPEEERSALGRTLYFGNLLSEAHLLLRRGRFQPEIVDRFLQNFGMNLEMLNDVYPQGSGA